VDLDPWWKWPEEATLEQPGWGLRHADAFSYLALEISLRCLSKQSMQQRFLETLLLAYTS